MKCLRLFLVTLVFLLTTAATSSAFVNGDINHDDRVTLDDGLLAMRYVAGTTVCYGNGILPGDHLYPCYDIEFSCRAIEQEFIHQDVSTFPPCLFGASLILQRATGHI